MTSNTARRDGTHQMPPQQRHLTGAEALETTARVRAEQLGQLRRKRRLKNRVQAVEHKSRRSSAAIRPPARRPVSMSVRRVPHVQNFN